MHWLLTATAFRPTLILKSVYSTPWKKEVPHLESCVKELVMKCEIRLAVQWAKRGLQCIY